MADYTAYFNGEWVPFSDVKIDPMDRGFMLGDVVFDVERTFNGRPFRLRQHVERLYRSLKYVRIDPGLSLDEMINLSEEVVQRNEHLRADVGDFTIQQFVTRGKGRIPDAGPPAVCVKIGKVDFSRYARAYSVGANAVITKTRSYSAESLDPKVKHFSRMNFNLAELEANDLEEGSYPLLMDMDGNLTEGVGYNFFMVTDGVLRTAGDKAVLQGVSRGMVFDLARQLDIPVVEEDLQPYDLYTSDEAFIATTSPCVLPVTRVDKREIGNGKPGPIVKQLLAAWSEAVGMDIIDQAIQFANN